MIGICLIPVIIFAYIPCLIFTGLIESKQTKGINTNGDLKTYNRLVRYQSISLYFGSYLLLIAGIVFTIWAVSPVD